MTPQMAGIKNNGKAMWSTPPAPLGTQEGIAAMTRTVTAAAQGPASNARNQMCIRAIAGLLWFEANTGLALPTGLTLHRYPKRRSVLVKHQKLNVADTR